jgi:hypothetical protein
MNVAEIPGQRHTCSTVERRACKLSIVHREGGELRG